MSLEQTSGRTALHTAGSAAKVHALLAAGADIGCRDKVGGRRGWSRDWAGSPAISCTNCHVGDVPGALPPPAHDSPCRACSSPLMPQHSTVLMHPCFLCLLSAAPSCMQSGCTPLHTICQSLILPSPSGEMQALQALLLAGARVDATDDVRCHRGIAG